MEVPSGNILIKQLTSSSLSHLERGPGPTIISLLFFSWHLQLSDIFLILCLPQQGPSQVVLVVKNPPTTAGDIRGASSIPGSERSPEERNGNPLPYSCLEHPMNRGAWWATVQRVAKSWTGLKQLSTHATTLEYKLQKSRSTVCVV